MNVLWNTLSRSEWCSESREFADYSLYQHWDYGAEQSTGIGRSVVRVAVRSGSRIAAMAQCRIKRLPFMSEGVVEVDRGPMWRHKAGADAAAVAALLSELRYRLVQRQRLMLRIKPPPENSGCPPRLSEVLVSAGLVRNAAVRCYRTLYVDLRDDVEDIRKRFQQKWRNSLNAAVRNRPVIRCSSSSEAFSAFEQVYWEMWKRKRFPTGVRIARIRRIQERMPTQDKLLVSLAFAGGSCVAGHVAACLGDTCVYFLGATTEEGLRCKAAYALQWAVLKEAKLLGFTWYDLGGINPDANPGVTRFKRGMAGVEVEAAGQFDFSPAGGGGHWYSALECGYRLVRDVRQRGFRIRWGWGANGR